MTWFVASIGSLVIAAISYILGRFYAQSELLLSEKRRIYEEFLRTCPNAQHAYPDACNLAENSLANHLSKFGGILSLYAAPSVMLSLSAYLDAFQAAQEELEKDPKPLHPSYRLATQRYNDLILEMRRDAFAWSVFAHLAPARFVGKSKG